MTTRLLTTLTGLRLHWRPHPYDQPALPLDLWTCGHTADAACAKCYDALAHRERGLRIENAQLREQLQRLR
jgi:hypothetical protein